MKNVKRILFFCLAVGLSVNVLAADGDTHSFNRNLSQLLNNNASIPSITIPEQSYAVSNVAVSWEYNKNINPAVKITVKVGTVSFGEQSVGNNTTTTTNFSGDATQGEVVITFTNLTGNGTGHGTFKVTKVTLTEGSASAPCTNEVDVTKGTSNHGSFTLNKTKVCADGTGGTVKISSMTPDDGYQFKEITATVGTVDNTNKQVTNITAATTINVVFSKESSGTSEIEVVEVTKDNGIIVEYDLPGSASITLSQREEHQEGKLAEELFFSKYFEAASNVKLLAVFNGTKKTIDLSDYAIQNIHNGTSEKVVKFKDFVIYQGAQEVSFTNKQLRLPSGQELILITYQNNNPADADIITCAKDHPEESGFNSYIRVKTPTIQFNGDDAVILKNPAGENIDVVGAINHVSTYIVEAYDFMDDPGWYTPKGTKIEQKFSPEQKDYELSTNRCLLVRKRDVTSGKDAVRLNKNDFVTLGDYTDPDTHEAKEGEWKGLQIPGSGDAAQDNSCTGFKEVGAYDYGTYYNKWTEIPSSVITSTSNPDGTVTITVADLPQRACKSLKIEVKDGTDVLAENEFDVPIIIKSGAHTTKEDIFNKLKDTCKTCDVVILDGATLTRVNENGKHYGDSARTVDIYAGGKLIVPSGRTYYAENVILRTRSSNPNLWVLDAPEVVLNNSHMEVPNTAASPTVGQRVRIETGSNADLNFYMVSFPYDVVLSDVTFSDGTPATFNTDFFIYHYDGERRAAQQIASGNWVSIPANTTELKAGVGYLVAAAERTGHKYRELYFPMKNPALNAATGEADKKYVGVNAWGYGISGKRPNHVGWNFVANPYLRTYQKDKLDDDNSSTLSLGLLVMQDDGYWESSAPYVEYVTVLNSTATKYEQHRVSDKDLPAFQPFFIQIGRDGMTAGQGAKIEFKAANRAAASPIRRAVGDKPQKSSFGLLLSGADDEDNCGVVIGEQYSPAYEVMADLSKEFGSAYTLSTYTLQDNDNMRLAFHAVHPDRLTNVIPVGVRVPSTAEYTFRIDQRYDLSDFEHIYLQDTETGAFKDLLYETLSFSSGKAQIDNRFKLSVVMRAKTPTDIENTLSGIFASGRNGALMISGLPEKADIYVFDISGRLMVEDHTSRLNTVVYPLSSGVYQVRVEGDGKQVMLRTIVK